MKLAWKLAYLFAWAFALFDFFVAVVLAIAILQTP